MLAANAHQIILLEQESVSIQDELAGLPGVESKLKGFARTGNSVAAEVNEAHRLKGLRDREARSMQRARELLGQQVNSLRQLQGCVLGKSGSLFDPDASKGANSDSCASQRQNTTLGNDPEAHAGVRWPYRENRHRSISSCTHGPVFSCQESGGRRIGWEAGHAEN